MFLLKFGPFKNFRWAFPIYIPICFYLNKYLLFILLALPDNLHSNMFLLKYNQINQNIELNSNLHSNMFLLKSVIQISPTDRERIYIPICFYLNEKQEEYKQSDRGIYIPICFYLNYQCLL